jgi:hypothetical protein
MAYARNPAATIMHASGSAEAPWPLSNATTTMATSSPKFAARLHAWGWRNNDGTPFTLPQIADDNRLLAKPLVLMAKTNKRLFRDLMRAATIDLVPADQVPNDSLAPQLQEVIRSTQKFARNPGVEFGKAE